MEYRIDDLYQQAFGSPRRIDYRISEPAPDSEQPVDLNIARRDGFLGRNIQMPFQIGTFTMPDEPAVEIEYDKRIVKKPVAGGKRKGTIKEIIGEGDFRLRIRGIMIGTSGIYPIEDVMLFMTVVRLRQVVPVTNYVCRVLGIKNILIERVRLPDMAGVEGAQAYEVIASSDEDIELTLISELNI